MSFQRVNRRRSLLPAKDSHPQLLRRVLFQCPHWIRSRRGHPRSRMPWKRRTASLSMKFRSRISPRWEGKSFVQHICLIDCRKRTLGQYLFPHAALLTTKVCFSNLFHESFSDPFSKTASLGEMIQQLTPLGVDVPGGFGVSSSACE